MLRFVKTRNLGEFLCSTPRPTGIVLLGYGGGRAERLFYG